jgi:hypothetical protein
MIRFWLLLLIAAGTFSLHGQQIKFSNLLDEPVLLKLDNKKEIVVAPLSTETIKGGTQIIPGISFSFKKKGEESGVTLSVHDKATGEERVPAHTYPKDIHYLLRASFSSDGLRWTTWGFKGWDWDAAKIKAALDRESQPGAVSRDVSANIWPEKVGEHELLGADDEVWPGKGIARFTNQSPNPLDFVPLNKTLAPGETWSYQLQVQPTPHTPGTKRVVQYQSIFALIKRADTDRQIAPQMNFPSGHFAIRSDAEGNYSIYMLPREMFAATAATIGDDSGQLFFAEKKVSAADAGVQEVDGHVNLDALILDATSKKEFSSQQRWKWLQKQAKGKKVFADGVIGKAQMRRTDMFSFTTQAGMKITIVTTHSEIDEFDTTFKTGAQVRLFGGPVQVFISGTSNWIQMPVKRYEIIP